MFIQCNTIQWLNSVVQNLVKDWLVIHWTQYYPVHKSSYFLYHLQNGTRKGEKSCKFYRGRKGLPYGAGGKDINIINSKYTSTLTNHRKKQVWEDIAKQLNSRGGVQRTANQIKEKWRKSCGAAREEATKDKAHARTTNLMVKEYKCPLCGKCHLKDRRPIKSAPLKKYVSSIVGRNIENDEVICRKCRTMFTKSAKTNVQTNNNHSEFVVENQPIIDIQTVHTLGRYILSKQVLNSYFECLIDYQMCMQFLDYWNYKYTVFSPLSANEVIIYHQSIKPTYICVAFSIPFT
ncbi:unnamed protein product [Mytilus edulis]|uniref:Myb/SANT-like DNA-binding domain-containing protein n=1 Tax=Mytilus edulis TaxID=6550 RepID=A0A8S3TVU0_MYTED|nr:unnamed protein product [Mytilus edulis]